MSTLSNQPTNNHKTTQFVIVGVIVVLAIIGINAAESDDAPAPSPPTTQAELDAPAEASTPIETVVPDVVGMNHQAAQDTLQAAGFYLLLEEDATGQGRMLILDRNWEVVSQSVEAGAPAPTDTVITLSSKKIGE